MKSSPLQSLFKATFYLVQTLSPQLGNQWGINLFFTPFRFKRPDYEQVLLKEAVIEKVPLALSISKPYYVKYTWGKGPTILLVHGWAGRGSQMASFAKPFVEQGFQVVAFDAFGHGDSPGKQTNLLEFCAIVKDIEKQCNGFHAIIAHSFGGVASGFAIYEGIRTHKFVTIGSPASMDYILKGFQKQANALPKTVASIVAYLEKKFERDIEDFSLKNLVAQANKPGLIVHDKQDKEVQYQQAEELAQYWKSSSLLLTEGLGHQRILRDSRVIEKVVHFLVQDEEPSHKRFLE